MLGVCNNATNEFLVGAHFTWAFYLGILPWHFTLAFYLGILPWHFTLAFYLGILLLRVTEHSVCKRITPVTMA